MIKPLLTACLLLLPLSSRAGQDPRRQEGDENFSVQISDSTAVVKELKTGRTKTFGNLLWGENSLKRVLPEAVLGEGYLLLPMQDYSYSLVDLHESFGAGAEDGFKAVRIEGGVSKNQIFDRTRAFWSLEKVLPDGVIAGEGIGQMDRSFRFFVDLTGGRVVLKDRTFEKELVCRKLEEDRSTELDYRIEVNEAQFESYNELLKASTKEPDVSSGFVPIFDGTLKNWEGDPTYWRAEDGVLIGEVKPETLLKQNSFIVWRGGEVEDFELTAEYRVSAEGNSGINYRSIDVPGVKWAMEGYQDDIDGKDEWSGQNYEERGRTFLAYRGQSVEIPAGGKPQVVKVLGARAELQKKVLKEDWNKVHIIAKGNLLQHFTNGVLMAEVRDDDPEKRRIKGLIGVQVHVGPPMKIEFRNIRLKVLGKE